ncbi:hypothetical protein PVAP13_7KG152400 [Panicum virgatum]|uniref:phosphoribosylglycinamide formyltransferase 1 n=1 Tax=Panicum virgatum TaxID=38727 RepID=A0A8T0QH67_PANVG|nr:hypothetical protein PVAP13_7KG152400 [Panicum virgatum]
MEATAAPPPSLRPRRPLSVSPAPATRPGPKPRPWGLAASRRASAVRCELPRRPDPRPLRASAIVEDGGDAGGVGRRKRLAVFVSGGGSNFRAIHEAALAGEVRGDVVALVTDKPGCGGAEYARSNGIPVVVFPKSKSAPEGVSVPELLHALRYSGPTVHFVDEHYDTGKTLAQRVVPVFADDTPELLAARVLHEEHQVYVEAVAALCEDRIVWREDGVPLIKSRLNPDVYL